MKNLEILKTVYHYINLTPVFISSNSNWASIFCSLFTVSNQCKVKCLSNNLEFNRTFLPTVYLVNECGRLWYMTLFSCHCMKSLKKPKAQPNHTVKSPVSKTLQSFLLHLRWLIYISAGQGQGCSDFCSDIICGRWKDSSVVKSNGKYILFFLFEI